MRLPIRGEDEPRLRTAGKVRDLVRGKFRCQRQKGEIGATTGERSEKDLIVRGEIDEDNTSRCQSMRDQHRGAAVHLDTQGRIAPLSPGIGINDGEMIGGTIRSPVNKPLDS